MGIVNKTAPMTEKESSRKSLYSINDNLFSFHYKYVFPHRHAIEQELGEHVYMETSSL